MDDFFLIRIVTIAIVLIGIVEFIVLVLHFLDKPKREALRKIAGRFQGKVSFVTGVLKARFQEFDFSIWFVSPGKNIPSRFALHLSRKFPFNLRIYRKTLMSRLGARMGLVREVQINDPSFGSDFLIFSNRPVQAVHFLSTNAKNILRGLFAEGVDTFNLDAGGIRITKPYSNPAIDLAPEKIEQLLRQMLSIAGGAL